MVIVSMQCPACVAGYIGIRPVVGGLAGEFYGFVNAVALFHMSAESSPEDSITGGFA